jgi:hypothetical protein
MNNEYIVEGIMVFEVKSWDDGSSIRTYIGLVVGYDLVEGGANIKKFENEEYVIKEFVPHVEDDDENKTAFFQLLQERYDFWKSQGSAV